MKAKVLVLLGIVCLLSAVLMLSGCGMIADKVAEKASEEIIEGSTGSQVDIEGEDGATASLGEGAQIPDDFPDDVPVYEGNILGAMSGDGAWTLQIETDDDPKTVLDFYAKELEAKGWAKETTVNTGDGGMYSAKKDDRTTAVVAAASGGQDEEMTSVTVSVSTN